jgi:FtsP/CotA-like multicopper oxidase with cupredoxin domain
MGAGAAARDGPGLAHLTQIAGRDRAVGARPLRQDRRFPLPRLSSVSRGPLTLTAGESTADIGPSTTPVWTLNGSFPAPTIRLARGQQARIDLVNELGEPTILHWHGLNTPESADGHPRFAIGPGETYGYRFDVLDRPGVYWYHPHTHQRTAPQTYMGMAGLIVVEDDAAPDLGLPSREHEIPLILQDKRLGGSDSLEYDLRFGPDVMLGYLGDTAFGNGVVDPTVRVQRGRYRLRVLNASNARIFDLGFTDGIGSTLVGSDGGLLEAPIPLDRVMMGTGERADLIVDFSSRRPGDRIMLRSFAFDVPGMMMGMGMGPGRRMGGRMGMMGGVMQGAAMDLLEFVVTESTPEPPPPLPSRLSILPRYPLGGDTTRRRFRFESFMMSHTINGRSFDLERIDERVPLGRTEVWTLVNGSELPHPVHIHGGQFRVVSRTGGRNRVMPWETGLKDTVLLLPNEEVDVAVRFADHPGVFLLHCHTLEHEDSGMMLNFEVVE